MKPATTILALLSLLLAGGAPANAGGPRDGNAMDVSYYGENDQVDLYQAGVLKAFADSSVALFSDRAVVKNEASGNFDLKSVSLKDKLNLKPGQPFEGQPSGAYCSGVLVGPDLVLTAGHCFQPDERGGPCDRVKLVFGYAVTRAGETPASFPARDVYTCKKVVAQKVQDENHNFTCRNGKCDNAGIVGDGPDYALVKLDRPVAGRLPLAVSRQSPAVGTEVGVIGYPSGLPVKVQEKGAAVRELKARGYFVTNLDTFRGNSGSPVFDMRTLKIIGIISRGGADYAYESEEGTTNDPRRPYLYTPGSAVYHPQDGGRGEDVTMISEIQGLIPSTQAERSLDAALKAKSGSNSRPIPVVPAIYVPGQDGGGQLQPAIYTVPDAGDPVPVRI